MRRSSGGRSGHMKWISGQEDQLAPSDITSCAIIIPTHNRARMLEGALASIATTRANYVGNSELIVVNDGSTDDTAVILTAAQAAGHIDRAITHTHTRGPAAARNAGWRATTAPLIAFTDDDCEVAPDWLDRLVHAIAELPPQIAGVGGRVEAACPGLIADYMTHHRILEPPESLSYLVTANALFRREALEAVDGFDEAVIAPGGEDPGLCLRLKDMGYRFAYEEHAVVAHHYRQRFTSYIRTFYRYGRGCHLVMDP
jgi:glycosyltransferase involved in cell wall biosynthesis